MKDEIVLFLRRFEFAKETLVSLSEIAANLERLSKIDRITFGDSGIVLRRDFNPDYFDKLVYVVIDTEKQKFEESKSMITDILDGKYDEEIKGISKAEEAQVKLG